MIEKFEWKWRDQVYSEEKFFSLNASVAKMVDKFIYYDMMLILNRPHFMNGLKAQDQHHSSHHFLIIL